MQASQLPAVASDGDIPYEGYVPMYADVDVLRRGSFLRALRTLLTYGNLSSEFGKREPSILHCRSHS